MSMFKSEPKRLVIKGFKGPRLPDDFETSCWDTIKGGIVAILNGHRPICGFEAIYRASEAMVRASLGRELYNRLTQELEAHARHSLQPKLERALTGGSTMSRDGVEDVLLVWSEWKGQMRIVSQVLLYLDRVWAPENRQATVEQNATSLFRGLLSELIIAKLQTGFRSLLSNARINAQASSSLIGLVALFRETGLFTDHVEPMLLHMTAEHYQAMTLSNQPRELLAAVDREGALLQSLALPPSCQHLAMERVEQAVLLRGLETVLLPNFGELMSSEAETSALLALAQRCNRLDQVRLAWSSWIRTEGAAKIANIEGLLAFRERLDHIMSAGWHGEASFCNTLKDAFETAINGGGSRVAELLSLHLDAVLSKDSGAGEAYLVRLMALFRHLQGKEHFETLHRTFLARRLIAGSINRTVELAFIRLLREECGSAYVSRMESMFKDVEVSQEMMRGWRGRAVDKRRRTANPPESVDILVANSGFWPHSPPEPLPIPASVQSQLESFTAYYGEQFEGRRLQWHHSLGTVELKRSGGQNPQELLTTIPQALVLLHLETGDASEADLVAALQMSQPLLASVLASLVRVGIVVKGDKFSLNSQFTSKHSRLRLCPGSAASSMDATSSPTIDVSGQSDINTLQQLRQDRQARLDACIVRLVKRAKKIHEAELLSQVAEHQAQIGQLIGEAEISARLQALIEREYIARSKDDSSLLEYMS